jgi:hypothetical protein
VDWGELAYGVIPLVTLEAFRRESDLPVSESKRVSHSLPANGGVRP